MKKRVKKIKKLSRRLGHRQALVRNLIQDLILKEKIKTTLIKAKTIRPLAEKLITRAKKSTPAGLRQIEAFFYSSEAAKKIIEEIGPRFASRPGGYTRIVKLGPRKEDAAEEALIELVEE